MSEEIVVDGVVLVASLSIATVAAVASPLVMVDKDDEATAAAAAAAVKLAEDVDGSDGV